MKKIKIKFPILIVNIAAILLIFFSLSILIMVFVSLYLHFFGGYPIPQNVSWGLDLLNHLIISILLIVIAIGLFKRNFFARILGIFSLFIISILNLRAELFIADSPAIASLIMNALFFVLALYLLFNKDIKKLFKK